MQESPIFPPKNTASLYSVGSSKELLLTLAKYYPNEKDTVMALILQEKHILPNLSKDQNLPNASRIAYDLCIAYPVHASEILRQILHSNVQKLSEHSESFGLSSEATAIRWFLFCLPANDTQIDSAQKIDFAKLPELFAPHLDEFFTELYRNDILFEQFFDNHKPLANLFNEFPHIHASLITALLRQNDEFWRTKIEQVIKFTFVARKSRQYRDQLFSRYLGIPNFHERTFEFTDQNPLIDQLLNLIFEADFTNDNEWCIEIFTMLIDLYPEHRQNFVDLLCANQEALQQLFFTRSKPFRFFDLVAVVSECKDQLLQALCELPVQPGMLGLITHNAKINEQGLFELEKLIRLKEYFPDLAARIVLHLEKDTLLLLLDNLDDPVRMGNYALHLPEIFNTLTQCLTEKFVRANAQFDENHYQGKFAKTLWPWIEMVRAYQNADKSGRSDYNALLLFVGGYKGYQPCTPLEILCRLFLDDKAALEAFFAQPKLPTQTVFDDQQQLTDVISSGIPSLCTFLNDHPQYQERLVSTLRRNPVLLNTLFKDGSQIYALFLLMPKRKLLFQLLSLDKILLNSTIENAPMETLVDSVFTLPRYVPYFIRVLLQQDGFAFSMCHSIQSVASFIQIPGHQAQIVSYLCRTPSNLNTAYNYLCTYEQTPEHNLPKEWYELIFISQLLSEELSRNNPQSLQSVVDFIQTEFQQGIIYREQLRAMWYLVRNMQQQVEENTEEYHTHQTFLNQLRSMAIPKLSRMCTEILVQRHQDEAIDISSLNEEIQEEFLLFTPK